MRDPLLSALACSFRPFEFGKFLSQSFWFLMSNMKKQDRNVLLWECHSTKQQWKSTRWAFLISSFVCMFHIYHNNNFSSLKSGIQFTSSFYFLLRWQLQTILHTNTHRQYIHMWKSMQLPTLKYTEFIHTT